MDATSNTKLKTVDEYLSSLPANAKAILKEIGKTIKKAAPQAEALISYGMPAFKFHGMLVYYAAWKSHIGFYPVSSAIKAFEKELSGYEYSKGSIKFPIDQPIPFDLIKDIVKFRVLENLEKAKTKETKKLRG